MKKLNKLEINSEKIMKNEELITLRGGYDPTACCLCKDGDHIYGFMLTYEADCDSDCHYAFSSETVHGYWTC